ncbi:amidase [Nocardioides sp.]|uniref:amidase n=1 Tax=Nocardioides sp. TaxID=35761 RepID=UPI003516C9EE
MSTTGEGGTDATTDQAPPGLLEAFWAYERALGADDVGALDRLFAPGPGTLRGDADGLLVGHDAIADFRRSRGGAPERRIVAVHVVDAGPDHALVVAITELARGGRGQQTQLWRRGTDGWQVAAAHVAVPAPALDTRIWRVVGDPLLPAAGDGPLTGHTVAVKDLFAVAGHPLGAGNPAWLAAAAPETQHAAAVATLLDAGAAVRGISRTDEFAYSLAGTNHHHGSPPNPRAPHRISGGSSSGSASAVALGHASIGLGTDTGGSVRVPAAYQGLFGIRTTHGAVSREGLLPLAPTFDTVGWLTRDAATLAAVGDVLLPDAPAAAATARLNVVPELMQLADSDVAATITAWLPERRRVGDHDLADLPAWREAFVVLQAWEAWQAHGAWLDGRLDTLGPDVRGRFERAATITAEAADAARRTVEAARDEIRERIADDVWLLPAAPTVAPLLTADVGAARERTLTLTCVAGIGGLPAVTVPLTTAGGLPCGVCLVAAPGRDRELLALAADLDQAS